MPKIKKDTSCEWVPIKLDGTVLSQGVDGLIGIEELTNYTLEGRGNKKKVKISRDESGQKKKRCEQLEDHSDDNFDSGEPSFKKVKVNKCKKNKENSKKERTREAKFAKPTIKESESRSNGKENVSNDTDDTESIKSKINIEAWSSLGVPTFILKALADQNFEAPTAIQALTLAPAILGRRDILGAAETGSGKTLAFGIPIINGIVELKGKYEETIKSEENESEKCNYDNVNNKGWICTEETETVKQTVLKKEVDDSDDTDEETPMEVDCEEQQASDSDFSDTEDVHCVRVIDNVQMDDLEVSPKKPLYALILTPTRELAVQIKNHLVKVAKYTDIKIAVVLGGMAAVKQERILSKGPEIVIATPGRLWELINTGNPHLSQIDCIKYLAIDETDRMLEKGHFRELHQLLERMNKNEIKMRERQNFVFSATLTMVHDIPQYLQRKKSVSVRSKIFKLTPGQKLQKIIHMLKINNPKIVDVTKQSGIAGNLTECRIACTLDHKDYYLYYFLKRYAGRTLIFCNSIGCVRRLATLLGILDCNPLPLHASMQQRQRLKNLERFQEDENGLLIATDVAARGLDIPNVEHVIHYQVPRTSESYIHRSGRTARAQKDGITVLMMEPSEMHYYTRLCTTLGRMQDMPMFPVIDRLLVAVKQRVNVAREIDRLELKYRRGKTQKGWLEKTIEEMDLVVDDDDQSDITAEEKANADLRRQLKAKKRQLASLLVKPLFPKGFSGKYLDNNLQLCLNQDSRKAVEVMKTVLEENPKRREQCTAGIVIKKRVPKNKKRLKKAKKH